MKLKLRLNASNWATNVYIMTIPMHCNCLLTWKISTSRRATHFRWCCQTFYHLSFINQLANQYHFPGTLNWLWRRSSTKRTVHNQKKWYNYVKQPSYTLPTYNTISLQVDNRMKKKICAWRILQHTYICLPLALWMDPFSSLLAKRK